MLKAILGITKEPFSCDHPTLLSQQHEIATMLSIHANTGGGLSLILGHPGVGKSVLREHIEQLAEQRDIIVASCSRTMHTYTIILKQLAESFKISASTEQVEKLLIQTAFKHASERKTLYILIDEAHLLDILSLRKLRLLFDRFPKKHNLILFGQPSLLHSLSLHINQDLKSRVTYSATLLPLTDEAIAAYIDMELDSAGLGKNTFDEAAIDLIIRSCEGNLRLCRNLCHGSLIQACRQTEKQVRTTHVNAVLIQPHWRSHDELRCAHEHHTCCHFLGRRTGLRSHPVPGPATRSIVGELRRSDHHRSMRILRAGARQTAAVLARFG